LKEAAGKALDNDFIGALKHCPTIVRTAFMEGLITELRLRAGCEEEDGEGGGDREGGRQAHSSHAWKKLYRAVEQVAPPLPFN
jgi:hypothetical protein